MLAVRGGSGIAMGRLGVPLHTRHSAMPFLVPKDLSGVLIERQNSPDLGTVVVRGTNIAVESDFEIPLPTGHGGEIDTILPNDRRGMCQSRNFGAPGDVLTTFEIPANRESGGLIDPAGTRTAKLRPIRTACDRNRGNQ